MRSLEDLLNKKYLLHEIYTIYNMVDLNIIKKKIKVFKGKNLNNFHLTYED